MTLLLGDCRERMAELPADSVDSIITDPPYGLSFMGKGWDHGVPGVEFWTEALRVAKPGAFLLAFGGTRTFHRLTCAIEDAGWEIRDCIMWVYSQGFPKSHAWAWDLHEAACVSCGNMVCYNHEETRPDTGRNDGPTGSAAGGEQAPQHLMRFVRAAYLQTPVYACAECGQVLQPFMSEQSAPATRAAWMQSEIVWPEQPRLEGRGDLEAPEGELQGCEVCTLSHGILADGSEGWVHNGASASNGPIPWQVANEDGSRPSYRPRSLEQLHRQFDAFRIERCAQKGRGYGTALKPSWEPIIVAMKPCAGSFACNALEHGVAGLNIDGSRVAHDEPIKPMKAQSGGDKVYGQSGRHEATTELKAKGRWPANLILDGSDEVVGLFPWTKSAKRNPETCGRSGGNKTGNGIYSDLPQKGYPSGSTHGDSGTAARFFYVAKAGREERNAGLGELEAIHPTVKPIALMKYLCILTRPPTGGVVMDPFMGSGTTGIAAVLTDRDFIGIEMNPEYLEIARRRIEHHSAQGRLPL